MVCISLLIWGKYSSLQREMLVIYTSEITTFQRKARAHRCIAPFGAHFTIMKRKWLFVNDFECGSDLYRGGYLTLVPKWDCDHGTVGRQQLTGINKIHSTL